MRTLPALILAAALASTAEAAAPKKAPPPAKTPEPIQAPEPITASTEALMNAVRKGDQALMRRLTGTSISLTAKRSRPLRISQDYSEFVAFTGPEFKLSGGASGIEVILRIPNTLLPEEPPELVTYTGMVTGFELMGEDDGTPGDVAWVPIVSVSFLK